MFIQYGHTGHEHAGRIAGGQKHLMRRIDFDIIIVFEPGRDFLLEMQFEFLQANRVAPDIGFVDLQDRFELIGEMDIDPAQVDYADISFFNPFTLLG